jgi:Trk-type K+ transport system membrane component
MYISVYPIAMSVRATNVYEERSLGVFDNDSDDSDEEEEEEELARKDPNKVVGWSRYLAFHARRQLAFDIWWLGGSLPLTACLCMCVCM